MQETSTPRGAATDPKARTPPKDLPESRRAKTGVSAEEALEAATTLPANVQNELNSFEKGFRKDETVNLDG